VNPKKNFGSQLFFGSLGAIQRNLSMDAIDADTFTGLTGRTQRAYVSHPTSVKRLSPIHHSVRTKEARKGEAMQTTSAQDDHKDDHRESLSALDQFRREAQRIPPLEESEELDLVQQARCGARDARDRLVEGYQIHLLRLARRYAPRCASLTLLDLVQEGNLGLLAALERIDKWDGERPFRQWALGWAQKRMTRAAWPSDGLVQFPDYTARRVKTNAQTASADTMGALGAPSTSRGQETRPRIVNLEEHLGAIEVQAARTAGWEGELSSYAHSGIQEQLHRLLQSLSAAERRLLTLRFGLNGAPPQTLEQVSSQLRLSLPTVQEQERLALQRLRHAYERSA
jgi:RNA polymerase primary sigma factor